MEGRGGRVPGTGTLPGRGVGPGWVWAFMNAAVARARRAACSMLMLARRASISARRRVCSSAISAWSWA